MNNDFELTIRTPEEVIFSGKANGISFAAEGGDMQIFADHASITATIAFTPLIIGTDKKEEHLMVRNGVFTFNNAENYATLLALSIEAKSEISQKSVKEYLEFLNQQLAEGRDLSDFQILYLKGEKLAVEQQIEEL